MPPNQKPGVGETAADRQLSVEAKRIRVRASPTLIQQHTPPRTSQIPTPLRKSDGADIIKRNTSRKKKYLFVFPGALSFPPPGGVIGSLTSLDTRNPILNIEYPSGTFRLLGTLVFPQNAFITAKPAKRALQVIDVFETLIVFSEWRWLGNVKSNPGGVPAPLPDVLKAPKEDLWRSGAVYLKENGDVSDVMDASNDGESSKLTESDEDRWAAASTERVAPTRSNPRRRGKVINYSQMENDDSDDASGEKSAVEDHGNGLSDEQRKHGSGPQDLDDSVQIVEDLAVTEMQRGVMGRRKRMKIQGIQASEDEDTIQKGNGSQKRVGEINLALDESLEILESVRRDDGKVKPRRESLRTRRKINYSQDSGDEYDVDFDEDEDEDDYKVAVADEPDVMVVE